MTKGCNAESLLIACGVGSGELGKPEHEHDARRQTGGKTTTHGNTPVAGSSDAGTRSKGWTGPTNITFHFHFLLIQILYHECRLQNKLISFAIIVMHPAYSVVVSAG